MVLKSNWHVRFEIKYHFVWCPKYRRMVLKGNIGKYLAKIIYEVAERYDFCVEELAVMSDHVHLFVSSTPNESPAEIMRKLKSITARELFRRFPSIKKGNSYPNRTKGG